MSHHQATRREFLKTSACLAAGTCIAGRACQIADAAERKEPFFKTRGVVLRPADTLIADWPDRAKRAGLTTIASHPFPGTVLELLRTDAGRKFFDRCREIGLQVEHELHAMRDLLSRRLFAKNPELFRMDDKGDRVPDFNCCPSNEQTLKIAAESAVEISKKLPSTTGRYFYWGDDARPWCRCPKCRGLSDSDQALLIENAVCLALRQMDPRAQLAHLAYANTLWPPKQIKPAEGVFLEYAPINRRYDIPYEKQAKPGDRDSLAALEANLAVFSPETAQVLEYWLDVGMFSGRARSKQPIKLPWNKEVFLADLETYRHRGIRHITCFATGVNPEYQKLHGDLSFIEEYGAGLSQ